jgi:hypothetical protein
MYLGSFLFCCVFRVALYTASEISYSPGCPVRNDVNKGEMLFPPVEETGRSISV